MANTTTATTQGRRRLPTRCPCSPEKCVGLPACIEEPRWIEAERRELQAGGPQGVRQGLQRVLRQFERLPAVNGLETDWRELLLCVASNSGRVLEAFERKRWGAGDGLKVFLCFLCVFLFNTTLHFATLYGCGVWLATGLGQISQIDGYPCRPLQLSGAGIDQF